MRYACCVISDNDFAYPRTCTFNVTVGNHFLRVFSQSNLCIKNTIQKDFELVHASSNCSLSANDYV